MLIVKILKIITNIFLGILIAIGLVFSVPRAFNSEPTIVLSGSMEPSIKTGSIVFINKAEKDPEPGDIVTYMLKEDLITHRVLRIEDGEYITKGDANDSEDFAPVKKEQIYGTVRYAVPYLGYVANRFHDRFVILYAGAAILVSLLLDSIQELILELKKKGKDDK